MTTSPSHQQRQSDLMATVVLHNLQSGHRGRDQGISAQQLAQKCGLPERSLRTAISMLREEGIAVVGTPESGYYLAQTSEEVEECCQFLRSRAMHSLTIEARLRQLSLPELLGQMRLTPIKTITQTN